MVNTKNSNKVAHVGNLLTNKPHLTPMEIAKEVGCHVTLVYQVRKAIFKKTQLIAKGKTKTKAKVTKEAKKVVEKVLATVTDEDLLVGACKVIDALVKATKGLCFAFDHQKKEVEILWQEELYDVSIAEVPQTIEAIRFLQSKEKNYRGLLRNPSDYDDSIPF